MKRERYRRSKKETPKITRKNVEELVELEVEFEISKAIGEELIAHKKKYGKEYKDIKVKVEDIKERINKKYSNQRKEA